MSHASISYYTKRTDIIIITFVRIHKNLPTTEKVDHFSFFPVRPCTMRKKQNTLNFPFSYILNIYMKIRKKLKNTNNQKKKKH